MHLKVFLKLKKTLKTLSSGQLFIKKKQKTPKKPKNPKKNKKKQKTQKNPLGWFFFLKTRVFSNPAWRSRRGRGFDRGGRGCDHGVRHRRYGAAGCGRVSVSCRPGAVRSPPRGDR
jgi:hypothetical protein